MTYWVLSGGPNGGDQRAGWPEAKKLLEAALSAGATVNERLTIRKVGQSGSHQGA